METRIRTTCLASNSQGEETIKDFLSTERDYDLWVLLRQASHAVWKTRQVELRKYGISAEKAEVLSLVQASKNKATIAELSRQLLREAHSVSGLVIRMEGERLVRKVGDLGRKNLVRVVLTRKGREAYSLSVRRQSIHKAMSVLSEEEKQRLLSSLKKIRDKALE